MATLGTNGYTRGYTWQCGARFRSYGNAAYAGNSKWAQQDSNLRPADYESAALTN
jgi:hypothetical protein